MIAVTLQHKAWIEAAGIAGALTFLCIAYVLTKLARREPLIPRAWVWTPPGAHSPSPRVSATSSNQRGVSYEQSDPACIGDYPGAEFDEIEWYWPSGRCAIQIVDHKVAFSGVCR